MTVCRTLGATVLALVSSWAAAQSPDPDLARNLAATCANCHGTNGQARGKDVVALAGVPAERIMAQLAGYKNGAEPATIMHQIAKGYTDQQLMLVAQWFAAQKPAP